MSAFSEETEQLSCKQLSAGAISNLMNPVTFVLINLAVVLLVHVGALKVQTGILTQGLVIALYNYMSQILVELIKMANLIISMTKAAACAGRVAAVLEIPAEQEDGHAKEEIRGAVEFRDVTAKYHGAGEASLKQVSFSAAPGETVGVIGGTGSGKTTLVNLIPRLYDAFQGQVMVDGVDVREWNMDTLKQSVGIVPQKAVLFKGTVRENLCWGKADATDTELWVALEIAQAREVVKDKKGELDRKSVV